MIDFIEFSSRCLFLTLIHSIWQFTALAIVVVSVGRLLRSRVDLNYTVNVAALVVGLLALPVTFCLIGYAGISADKLDFETDHAVASNSMLEATTSWPQATASAGEFSETIPVTASIMAKFLIALEQLSPWISGLYFAGVALMFTRLSFAIRRTGRIKSHSHPVSIERLDSLIQTLAKTWSMSVVPKIALAEEIVVPKVVGVLRPTILLPVSAITGLSQDELEMVITHELAHIQRHDMWVNLLQRHGETVMFINPAMWFVSLRIESLREYCCDEKACESLEPKIGDSTDQSRTRYALALLRVIELAQESVNHAPLPKNDLTALAVSGRSPSELRRRVARLFGEPLREPIRLSWGSVLFGVMALLMLVGPTVWQARAESAFNVKATIAESLMPDLKTVEIRNNPDRIIVMSDDAAVETADMVNGTEISLLTDLVEMHESSEYFAKQSTLRGQVVDESGNPLPHVKVVLYGGFITRIRGQETHTDEN